MARKIFLITLLVFSFMAQTVSAIPSDVLFLDEEVADSSNLDISIKEKLFLALGLISGEERGFEKNGTVKYTDFLHMVKVILNRNESNYGKFYNELYNEDYVKNVSMPNVLSLNDLLYTMERIAGYGTMAEYYGGYPDGYLMVAENNKLLRGITIKDEKSLTYAEMVEIVFNVLDMPTTILSGVLGVNAEYVESKSLFENKFQIKHIRGILTASGITTLYGNSDLPEDTVEINRVQYTCEDNSIKEYIGYNLDLFVRVNDYEEKEIVAFSPYRNEVFKISTDNDPEWHENKITWCDENGKEKKSTLDGTKVIHNGLLSGIYDSLEHSELEDCSEITIIDNNLDSKADVVIVWEYDYLRISAAGEEAMTFTHVMQYNGNSSIVLNDDNIYYDIQKNGICVGISDIKVGDSVSVAQSKTSNLYGKKYLKMVLSTTSVNGKINGIKKDNGKVKIAVGEEEYILSDNYAQLCGILSGAASERNDVVNFTTGINVTIYLAHDNVIADAEKSGISSNTAYLVRTWSGDEDEESGFVKLFTLEEKFVTLALAEKVRFYGKTTGYTSGKRITPVEVVDNIKNEAKSDGDYRTVVIYETNSSNEITTLYMPCDRRGYDPGTVNYPNTLDFSAEQGKETEYYMGLVGLNVSSKVFLAPYTIKMFIVPQYEDMADEKKYKVRAQEYYGRSGIRMPYTEFYNVNQFYQVSLTVSITKVSDKPHGANASAIISEMIEVYDEANDEAAIQITCLQNGTEKTFIIPADIHATSDDAVANVNISDLKVGDVIQIDSSDNYINSIRLLKRLSEKGNNFDSDWTTYMDGVLKLVYGQVVEVSDTAHLIKLSDGKNYPVHFNKQNPSNILTVYLYENGKVRVIGMEEVRPGDKAFYVNNYGWTYTVYIAR